jgi:hypothetical protein
MVNEVARSTTTPPDMAATQGLALLSFLPAGRASVVVHDGWTEIAPLSVGTIAESGARKSAVQRALKAPIVAAQRSLEDAAQIEYRRAIAVRKSREEYVQELQRQRRKAKTGDAIETLEREIADAADAVADAGVPSIPKIVGGGWTVEAMISAVLAEQPFHGVGWVSDEGGCLDVLRGKYGGKNVANDDLDAVLQATMGETIDRCRVGSGERAGDRLTLHNPALGFAMCFQPSVIAKLRDSEAMRSRGFFARWLFSCVDAKVGYRPTAEAPARAEVLARYHDYITERLTWCQEQARYDVTLDQAAKSALANFRAEVEPMLRPGALLGDDLARTFGARLPAHALRIANALRLGGDAYRSCVIDEQTLQDAITIVRYFIPHWLRAMDLDDDGVDSADARLILNWIKKNRKSAFNLSELRHRGPNSLRNRKAADAVQDALELLVLRHYLRLIDKTYYVHPDFLEAS